MTLAKQLTIVIFILFIAIFAGSFFVSINNTRQYLAEQLQSHAQDTATSLGLSLSPHMEKKDQSTIASMVDAIYDRGYYTEISIENINGKSLYSRTQKVYIENVPAWFVNLVSLETPRSEALVMTGWRQAAKVIIRSHPGYAYQQLWKSTEGTFWLFLSAAIITFLIGMLAIQIILRPLNAIRNQAEAICAREFPIQQKIPTTPELRSVVQAMNKMSIKVKSMFDEMSLLTEKLRGQAYIDPVTGLGNRRYFDTQLKHLTQPSEEFINVALFLIELHDFKRYNEQHGYQAGDALLKKTTHFLKEACGNISEYFAARMTGGTFAILIPHLNREQATQYGDELSRALGQLQIVEQTLTHSVARIGIALFSEGLAASDLLAKADMALRAAQQEGGNTWRLFEEKGPQASVHGARYWQELLTSVIAKKDIILYFQPVVSRDEPPQIMHYEILVRIPDHDGKLLSAGSFLPMAENLTLAAELDKAIIEKVIELLQTTSFAQRKYAINLSANTLTDTAFPDWLEKRLKNAKQAAKQMIFEMTEYAAVNNLAGAQKLIGQLAKLGCQFTLDHFGRGFTTFGYLRSLKVNHIKIDGSYIRGIDQQVDNQFFVHSLVDIAHSLDIHVIAENVETESERISLLSLLIDGLQGYFIGAPKESI